MEKQQTFAAVAWTQKGKVTRRERLLAEMNPVIPWADLVGMIEPHYPKPGNGRQPLGLERMLRIYFFQQWFNLSDLQAEDSLYDSGSRDEADAQGQSVVLRNEGAQRSLYPRGLRLQVHRVAADRCSSP